MAKRAHIELSDRFSILADDLLICILSFLRLKEAAATSILSRRWRYLWTFTCNLNFDGLDFFRKLWPKSEVPEDFDTIWRACTRWENYVESWYYIIWVDSVLSVHKCFSIEEFRLDFFLAGFHRSCIRRWLRLASARTVRSLDLNFRAGGLATPYTLEYELLVDFKHLKKLRMQWVNVSDEGFEFILRTCPLLEELSVSLSEQLTVVKIIGPSLALKRLELNYCQNLALVEIRDAGLEFFMYQGKVFEQEQFVLKDVPRLVEMHLGGFIFRSMKDFLSMMQCYLPRLEKLTIDTLWPDFFGREGAMMLYENVKMSNLKQLVVKFLGVGFNQYELVSLVSLAYFIRASPLLQSFVLEVYCGGDLEVIKVVEEEEEEEEEEGSYSGNTLPEEGEVEATGSYRYPHLKRVEMVGYRFTPPEFDMVMNLLGSGSALEECIIDLRKRDNAWFYYNLFMTNSVTDPLPVGYPIIRVGYPCVQEDQNNALKADLKHQLTKRLPSTLHPRPNICIL